MRIRSHDRLPVAARTLALSAVVLMLLPILALAQGSGDKGAAEFENDLDGAWTGTIQSGGDTLLLQLNLNVEGDSGTAVMFTHQDDRPDEVEVMRARFERANARRAVLAFDLEEDDVDDGDDGDGDDGDDGDGDEDDGDEDEDDVDEEPGNEDDDFYGPDSAADDSETEDFLLRLRHRSRDDTLNGRLRGERRGRVTLHRIDTDEHPLQRIWTVRIGSGEAERLVLMQLLENADADSLGRFAATQVSGNAWVGGQAGRVTGERDNKDVELSIDLPGEQIDMSLRLRRGNNLLRGSITTADGTERGKLLPIGSNKGRPMKLRRVSPRRVQAGTLGFATVKGRNFGRGVTVHSDDTDVKVVSVERVNPRTLSVLLDVAGSAEDGRIALRAVNGDGQQHRRKNRLRVESSDDEEEDDDGEAAVSFSGDVAPIFAQNCALAGCHSAASAQEGLVLEPSVAYDNLVDVPSRERPELDRIEPGDPDNSYLVMKIRGDAGIQGGRMPLNRAPLSQQQIDTIVRWVEADAPDNLPHRE